MDTLDLNPEAGYAFAVLKDAFISVSVCLYVCVHQCIKIFVLKKMMSNS